MLSSISHSILDQLSELLSGLSSEEYSKQLAVFNGSSIGGHTRHVIEFYDCLIKGMYNGTVNYDERERDLAIQQNRDYAIHVIDHLKQKMMDQDVLAKKIHLKAQFGEHTMLIPTCWEREEAYLIEHSIHHFALIRIGVQENFPTANITSDFGLAYSTIAYREQKTSQSQTN